MLNRNYSRRAFLQHSLAMMGIATSAGLGLSACGGSSSSAGENGELNIFIWSEYVPEDLIASFEDEYGIKVNSQMFNTNENMLAKVKSGEEGAYDLLQPTGYMVKQLADQGMLQEIDTSALENLGNIGSQYMGASFDPSNTYSVPYMASVTAIAYDETKMNKPTSWGDLWSSDLEGQLVVLDDPLEVIGIGNLLLGYPLSNTDADTLEEVRAKILELKPNIAVYDSDSAKSSLISGDVYAGAIWTAEIALAQAENPSIQVAYPTEGCGAGIDNWVIPTGAKNVDAAMKFIDFMMRPENAKVVAEQYPYVQVNTAAIDLMDDDYKNNEARNVPADVFENCEFFETLPTETLKTYNDIWTELKQ